jgi:hypothetical protein
LIRGSPFPSHFIDFMVIKCGSRQLLYFLHLYQIVEAKGGLR